VRLKLSFSRGLFFVLFCGGCLATAIAQKSNAIVLIPPQAVSRAIQPENYNHGLWIQWPLPTNPQGSNRMLTPVTGLDWHLGPDQSLVTLKKIGALEARKSWVGPLTTAQLRRPEETQDPNVYLLAVDPYGRATEIAEGNSIPKGSLVVAHATSWDDAAKISKTVDGNTLIISYPPVVDSTVSAAWFLGREDVPVPTSTKVPGLVPARELFGLVTRPESYAWRPPTDVTAEQWMRTIERTRSVQLISLFCFALIAGVLAIRSVASESGGKFARLAIGMVPCAFIAVVLAGNFAKATGLMPWNILPFFAYLAILLGMLPVYMAMRALWPRSHPLFPIMLFAAGILLWAEPRHTIFTELFTPVPLSVSPLALGAFVATMTATVSLCFSGGLWPRLLAAALVCTAMLTGVLTHQWWAPGQVLLILPVLAVVAGSGAMRLYLLPFLILWPLLYHKWNGSFAWNPNWLLSTYQDKDAINTSAMVQFLLSPEWLITLVLVVLAALFGGDFMRHQIRRSLTATNHARGLFWAALGVACLAIREPYLLQAALVVLITGFLVLLFDATGST
jgi:hypothetical protein